MRSYIFNFKFLLIALLTFVAISWMGYQICNIILDKSGFRLAKVFNGYIAEENILFVGSSRTVPFNKMTLSEDLGSSSVFNAAFNGLSGNDTALILESLKLSDQSKNSFIFIQISHLNDKGIRCDFNTFIFSKKFDVNSYKYSCPKFYYFTKVFPLFIANSEMFLRSFYYFLMPEKDQAWFNNYIISDETCKSDFKIDENSDIDLNIKQANMLKNKFPDMNIKFFLSPYLKGYNFQKNAESKLKSELGISFIEINKHLNKNFYDNCRNFSDRKHLSKIGTQKVGSILIESRNF